MEEEPPREDWFLKEHLTEAWSLFLEKRLHISNFAEMRSHVSFNHLRGRHVVKTLFAQGRLYLEP